MAMAMRRRCSISILFRRRLSTAAALAPPSTSPKPSVSSRKDLSSLKTSLRIESDPEKILAMFETPAHLHHIYVNDGFFKFSVSKLAVAQRPDLVERLLESQKSSPEAPNSESFFIRIMSLYADASMPDHALRIFEQIPSRTEQSLTAVLIAYLKQNRYDRVRELFDRFPAKYGIIPGVTSHNILLSALCNAGEVKAARKVLGEMFDKKGFKPNLISYNILLIAYFKGDDNAGFEEILQEISRKGVPHNTATYNLRISNLCRRKEILKAEELVDELLSKELRPTGMTFGVLIKAFSEEGDADSALKVWHRMKMTKTPKGKMKIFPTRDTYIVFLRALVDKGKFSEALPICQECLRKKHTPPFDILKAIVLEMVKDSKSEQAKIIVEKMRKVVSGYAVDAWTKLEAELPL